MAIEAAEGGFAKVTFVLAEMLEILVSRRAGGNWKFAAAGYKYEVISYICYGYAWFLRAPGACGGHPHLTVAILHHELGQ